MTACMHSPPAGEQENLTALRQLCSYVTMQRNLLNRLESPHVVFGPQHRMCHQESQEKSEMRMPSEVRHILPGADLNTYANQSIANT